MHATCHVHNNNNHMLAQYNKYCIFKKCKATRVTNTLYAP